MKQRALVIRLSSLGDVVLATSVFEPLQEAGYELFFATKKSFAPLFEQQPRLAGVYSFGRETSETENRAAFLRWVEAQKFDLIIDLQDSLRTKLWRRSLSKITTLWVIPKPRWREVLVLFFRLRQFAGLGRGGRARYFREQVLQRLARQKQFPPLSGPLTQLAVAVDTNLLPWKGSKEYIAFFPASAWKTKEWPHFSSLAGALKERYDLVFLGGAEDVICDELAAAVGGISLRGKTSMRESMAVVKAAKWVVGNDTGFLHVAEALGKDVVMIEGPTHPAMGFSIYRQQSVLVGKNLVCRPCSKTGRFCFRWGSRACLRGLSPQEVLTAMRQGGVKC